MDTTTCKHDFHWNDEVKFFECPKCHLAHFTDAIEEMLNNPLAEHDGLRRSLAACISDLRRNPGSAATVATNLEAIIDHGLNAASAASPSTPNQVLVDRKWLEATQCVADGCYDGIIPEQVADDMSIPHQCQWCHEKAQALGSNK